MGSPRNYYPCRNRLDSGAILLDEVMLIFPEEVLLLLLDDSEGVFLPVGKSALELALTGSVMMELAFADRIDTDARRGQVTVINRAPTGNPSLDQVLERIANDGETRDVKGWIETLSVESTATIQEQNLANLVERGILRRESSNLLQESIQHLWIFRSPRYSVVDSTAKHTVKRRLTEVLFSDDIPHPRDVALVCLIAACDILRFLFMAEELERTVSRLDQLRKMDRIGREIADAIAEIERTHAQAMAHPLA